LGVFLGDFLEPIGPGASVRGLFSADGVLLVRWASGFLPFFAPFLRFFDRFLGAFCGHWALFASMSCAYLYVNNYFSAPLAWNVLTSNRKGRQERKGRTEERQTARHEAQTNPRTQRGGNGETAKTAQPSTQRSQRPALSERLALSPSKGASRRDAEGEERRSGAGFNPGAPGQSTQRGRRGRGDCGLRIERRNGTARHVESPAATFNAAQPKVPAGRTLSYMGRTPRLALRVCDFFARFFWTRAL